MKKLIFTMFLFLNIVTSSSAQSISTADEFYSYLNSILKSSNKSIQLVGTNYGAIGSKYNWEAKFKKNGNKIEIQYNSQKPSEDNSIIMSLDTTFVTTRKKLTEKFKNEIAAVKSRPIYFEETVKIVVNTDDSNKEYVLKRADGLTFLLRYDMSFEEYYKVKN